MLKFDSNMRMFFLLLIYWSPALGVEVNKTSPSFTDLYKEGIDAYLEERWDDCTENLEAAIHAYKLTLTAIADCRLKCLNEPPELFLKHDIEDLKFFEKIIKKTLCFVKCKRIRYPNVMFEFNGDMETIQAMEDLTPYSYLHMCFFKKKEYQKAASAVFTFLVKHPNDKITKDNFEYYLTLSDVNPRDVTNHEMPEYFPLYLFGINAYNNGDWDVAIEYMEEALHAYVAGEERCRALCEGSFDQGWLPDFLSSVANHFTYCLKCKQKCPERLKTLNGLKGKEIMADIYNYLQFCYQKLNKLSKAYRSVASYLLIYPTDEQMIQNKKIYSQYATPEEFTPRTEIYHYLLREDYEKKLLQFIHESFTEEFQLEQASNPKKFDNMGTNATME